MTITSDLFTVGQSAMVTCPSDSGVAEMIEWQLNGETEASATSVQLLHLDIDLVSDSLDGSEIVCVVTRSSSDRANQSLAINVNGKEMTFKSN